MTPSLASRLGMAWRYVRAIEPARLRAAYVSIVALLAVQGISISADLDGKVQTVLTVLAIVLPLVQGETTRPQVVPKARHEALLAAAKDAPPGG